MVKHDKLSYRNGDHNQPRYHKRANERLLSLQSQLLAHKKHVDALEVPRIGAQFKSRKLN